MRANRRLARPHGRRSGQRGAVALEGALIFPLLLATVLGMIEVSLTIRDYIAVTSASRLGARMAASSPDSGQCAADVLDNPPCAGQAPNFALQAAAAIVRSGAGLPSESIRQIMVYKANANGFPGSSTSMTNSCGAAANCVVYTWRPSENRFRYQSGTWVSKTVNACFPNSVDSVGVQVEAEHDFIAGFFGGSITLRDHSVMNFEPLPTAICASGQHD